MASTKDVIEGLVILMKHGAATVEAQHDILFAGPDFDDALTKEEEAKLKELGWHFDEETDSWAKFT